MNEDVLTEFALEIEGARMLLVGGQKLPSMACIVKLAAEVRALRERGEESGMIFRQLQRSAQAKDKTIRELQSRVAELEKELAFADSDVAAKRNYIDDLEREMACARKLDMDQLDQIKAALMFALDM